MNNSNATIEGKQMFVRNYFKCSIPLRTSRKKSTKRSKRNGPNRLKNRSKKN